VVRIPLAPLLLAMALAWSVSRGHPRPPAAAGATLPRLTGPIGGTGAYEREYWYEYDRSSWRGPRRFFPHGAEATARRKENGLREKYGFPIPESQVEWQDWTIGWKELGPRPLQPESGYSLGHVSGRIMSILLQKDKNRILIGSASGGIWRRLLDDGALFSPRCDHAPNLSIGALAADPNNSQRLFAGTGEPGISKDSFAGSGLLRSTNGGTSWSRIDDGTFTGHKISNVWVDPNNSQRILVSRLSHPDEATIGVLLESLDGGVHWAPLPAGGNGLTFAVSPADPNRILVSNSHPWGTTFADLLLSTNGGASFSPVNGPWTGTGKKVGRIDIAFAPSNPSRVWASVAPPRTSAAEDSQKDGIYRSTNGGASWDFVAESHHDSDGGSAIGWYSNPIAVAPNNSNVIYLGARNIYRYTLNGELETLTDWFGGGPTNIHGDQHVFVFDPEDSQTLYAGNDGGLYVSHDAGDTWEDMNAGLGITQFYYGCIGKNNGLESLFGGTQDNGSSRPLNLQEWEQTIGGDGFQCAVDPQDNAVVIGTTQYSDYNLSTDHGQTFSDLPTLPLGTGEEGPFHTPVTFDPNDGTRIYGGAQRVYRGNRNGNQVTWEPLIMGPMFPNDPQGNRRHIRRIAVAPTDGNTIYACGGNRMARTTEGGKFWFSINPPGTQAITDIAVHPQNKFWVYCTRSAFDGQQVLFAKDPGTGIAWKDITANLPNVPVNAIEIFLSGGGIQARLDAYLATDTGVYYSNLNAPGPIQWDPIGGGLPNAHVWDVMLADNGQTLIAATHGRGMWCIDTATIVKPTFVVSSADYDGLEAIPSGKSIRGFALFTRPPGRNTRASIESGNPAVLRVPAVAKFPRGKVSAWFTMTAGQVQRLTEVTVKVTVGDAAREFRVAVAPG
jgi:photosystem II stability/assembly factor-like uncharacterized protein